MANNGVDGNTSEFFVTGPDDTGSTNTNFSDGFLDFRYTIFGKLIQATMSARPSPPRRWGLTRRVRTACPSQRRRYCP